MVAESRADRDAAEAYLDGLAEPRRTQMRHLHEVILDALPDIDVGLWDYGGSPVIGYGAYDYSNSRGPQGRWFSVGLANRRAYISLYSMGAADGGYLVEAMHDRFPGTKIGRSCLNIARPEVVDDDAIRELARQSWEQYRHGFRRLGRG